MTLSVVIPTLNESGSLPGALDSVFRVPEVSEVLVVDGGSTDGTEALARARGCRWIPSARGRGLQCRVGALAAKSDVVLFLHADTWLPSGAGRAIEAALEGSAISNPVVGGAFRKRFRDAPWCMRGARFRSWLWFQLTCRPFADQAIWVRRSALESVGGCPDLPLMEEFELVRRLRNVGRIVLLGEVVSTSARRFRRRGVFRTYLLMARILAAHAAGTPPDELRRRYESA